MALKILTSALTAPATPPRCSSGHYKRRAPSPSFTAPLPAPISLSPRTLPVASPFCTVVARPPQRRPSSGETRAEFPSLPSPFCALAGELWCTGAPRGQALVSAPLCPLFAPASVHGGPSTSAGPRRRGPGPWIYPLEINSLFGNFATRSMDFL
jgi:hypothetical protein